MTKDNMRLLLAGLMATRPEADGRYSANLALWSLKRADMLMAMHGATCHDKAECGVCGYPVFDQGSGCNICAALDTVEEADEDGDNG